MMAVAVHRARGLAASSCRLCGETGRGCVRVGGGDRIEHEVVARSIAATRSAHAPARSRRRRGPGRESRWRGPAAAVRVGRRGEDVEFGDRALVHMAGGAPGVVSFMYGLAEQLTPNSIPNARANV